MKKCPYCAEEIQEEAIVCRYCGRELNKHPSITVSKKREILLNDIFSLETKIEKYHQFMEKQASRGQNSGSLAPFLWIGVIIGILLIIFVHLVLGLFIAIPFFIGALFTSFNAKDAAKNLSEAQKDFDELKREKNELSRQLKLIDDDQVILS